MRLKDSLKLNIDCVLGVRDSIGASIADVSIVHRKWSGSKIGEGEATETVTKMLPTPGIKLFNHDLRIKEGGTVQSKDILLTSISQHKYPEQSMIDGTKPDKLVEVMYDVGGRLYQVVSVEQHLVTWNVLLREISDQRRYPNG